MEMRIQTLAKQLREAESGTARENWRISEYVFSHIFWPLLNDEKVRFAELDFSRVDFDDLDVLAERISDRWRTGNTLRHVTDTFLKADPVSASTRAFC